MSGTDETDLAQAMIRLYGAKAESVAAEHAASCAVKGNAKDYEKWRRVKAMIADLRPHLKPNSGKATH